MYIVHLVIVSLVLNHPTIFLIMESLRASQSSLSSLPAQVSHTATPDVPATGIWAPEIHVTDTSEFSVMATEVPFSAALVPEILSGLLL